MTAHSCDADSHLEVMAAADIRSQNGLLHHAISETQASTAGRGTLRTL